jgi:hypothetical protein
MNVAESPEFRHLLGKSRDALAGGWDVQSTGERLATALVLNRPQLIESMGYTLAEAVDRIGPAWCTMLLRVQRVLEDEQRVPTTPRARASAANDGSAAS